MTPSKSRWMLQYGILIFAGIILLCAQLIEISGSAQTRKRRRAVSSERKAPSESKDRIARAITTVCKERILDKQGGIPIDVMATQRELPLTDPRAMTGKARAQRLLPIAKRLVPLVIKRLAAANNLEALSLNWIVARVEAVNIIKVEVEKRDNASWRPSEPHAIVFGTIFLAGLRSDEAMITVLAHELTHAINGTDQALQPLFMRIGAKASQLRQSPVGENAIVEVTCDLVGTGVVREYAARVSNSGTLRRRLARALEKNCVSRDLADEAHLSPRDTMRLLLRLDPELTNIIAGAEQRKRPKKRRRR